MWARCVLATASAALSTIAPTTITAVTAVTTGTLCSTATAAIPAAIPTSAALTTTLITTLAGTVVTHALQHFCAGGLGGCLHYVAAWRLARAAPDGLAAHRDGFAFFTGLRAEAFNNLHRNGLFSEAFDVLHEAFFVQAHQIDSSSIVTGAASTADAVHVVFADVGDFVIDHVWQFVDINTAGGNVGGYKGAYVAALETGQRLCTGCLALVAMQGHSSDAIFFQKLRHIVGTKFGAGEHQHLAPIVFIDDVSQQGLFLATADRIDNLGDALHGSVTRRDLHTLRVLEQAGSQFANFVAKGGREQQALLFLGNRGQHFFDVMDEAHVQHAVGFVQHQHLYLAQIQHALLHQVQQAPGCGDQNVHAFFQLGDLGVHAHAAENHGGAELQVFAVGADGFFNLGCQFAGGGQHQGTDAGSTKFVLRAAAHGEAVQQGQGEGSGLAGTGLGTTEQIATLQDQRDRLCLNGRWGFVTMLAHGFDDGRGQVQFFKVHELWRPSRALGISACTGAKAPDQSKADGFKGGTLDVSPTSPAMC